MRSSVGNKDKQCSARIVADLGKVPLSMHARVHLHSNVNFVQRVPPCYSL